LRRTPNLKCMPSSHEIARPVWPRAMTVMAAMACALVQRFGKPRAYLVWV
jgi:hypothetical protein